VDKLLKRVESVGHFGGWRRHKRRFGQGTSSGADPVLAAAKLARCQVGSPNAFKQLGAISRISRPETGISTVARGGDSSRERN
jgi:hypothetical protein